MIVSNNGYSEDLSLLITPGKGPSLIGKDSVEEESHESNEIDMEDDHGLYIMCTLEGRKAEPIMIGMLIDEISLEMELDTGASVSVISEDR